MYMRATTWVLTYLTYISSNIHKMYEQVYVFASFCTKKAITLQLNMFGNPTKPFNKTKS